MTKFKAIANRHLNIARKFIDVAPAIAEKHQLAAMKFFDVHKHYKAGNYEAAQKAHWVAKDLGKYANKMARKYMKGS